MPEMTGFSADLIETILSRLPVKSLLRFRCVSKSWQSIIDDSHFINLHLKQSLQSAANHTLIVRSCYLYSVDFPTLSGATVIDHPLKTRLLGTEILGSCNGLLCLSNSHESDHGGTIIYNPATKNQRQVPVSQIEFPDYFTRCDRMVYGFGYDSVNDDYKLVRIIQFFNRKSGFYDSEVKFYSLKTNSWRRVRDFPHDYYLSYKRANGVYVNECFHWVVSEVSVVESGGWGYELDESDEYESKFLIVAFDLRSEEVKVVPLPDYPKSGTPHINVGNLQGCLYLMCNYHKVCTDLWVMEEYGVKESWTKKFSFSQPGILGSFGCVLPIALSKDGSSVLLSKDCEDFVWVDVHRQRADSVRLKRLRDTGEVEVLVQSLVLGSKSNKSERKSKKNALAFLFCFSFAFNVFGFAFSCGWFLWSRLLLDHHMLPSSCPLIGVIICLVVCFSICSLQCNSQFEMKDCLLLQNLCLLTGCVGFEGWEWELRREFV